MVAAGVYLLARIFPVLEASPDALTVIGWIGGITCFGAGLMGLQQNDIKRILAYSTISQLGYMVLGVSVASSYGVPMFHLFTHAFFKCMLFLCSGSVILGMHHEQDIWKMGGLKNKMPITFLTMCIGGLALMGCPGLSGAFSKDLIIEFAYEKSGGGPLFWLAAGGVFLTALYTTRMLWVTFLGAPRSEAAKHAHESPAVMIIPLLLLAIPSVIAGYPFVQKLFFPVPEAEVPGWVHILIPGFFVAGLVISALIYRGAPAKDPVLIPFFANRLYIDDLYQWLVRWVQDGTAKVSSWTDRWIIDGVGVNFSAKLTWAFGFALRFLQIGNIQAYAFFFGAGVVGLLYILISNESATSAPSPYHAADRGGPAYHGRRPRPPRRAHRVARHAAGDRHSGRALRCRGRRFSIPLGVSNFRFPGPLAQFWRGWPEHRDVAALGHRDGWRGLGDPADQVARESFLCVRDAHFGGRRRSVCLDGRAVFLRVPRNGPHSDLFAHRYLGIRRPAGRGMEGDDLFGARQFRPAAWHRGSLSLDDARGSHF